MMEKLDELKEEQKEALEDVKASGGPHLLGCSHCNLVNGKENLHSGVSPNLEQNTQYI